MKNSSPQPPRKIGILPNLIFMSRWLQLPLYLGLILIAIGSGGIKPCVTAHVGDQFGKSNAHMLERVYGWFYFAINAGALISYSLIAYLCQDVSFALGWSIPTAASNPRLAISANRRPLISPTSTCCSWPAVIMRLTNAPQRGIFK